MSRIVVGEMLVVKTLVRAGTIRGLDPSCIPSWVGGASGPWAAWEPKRFWTTRVERVAAMPALQRKDMMAVVVRGVEV